MQPTALILAGGFGTRLRTKVSDRPKAMALVAQKPFLDYLFDQLILADIKHVILSTGYLSERIEKSYQSRYEDFIDITFSKETTALGTAGALRLAYEHIKPDDLLVLNGDSYCDFSIQNFIDWHHDYHFKLSLVLNYQEDASRFASVKTDSNSYIISFEEKSKNTNGPAWINAGIYLINKELILEIEENKASSLEYDYFPKWIDYEMGGYKTKSKFIDIGTPESYEEAQVFFEELGRPI
jgi:D-glycero-alpha-D-manno-heptose 1-phosphate guanylyltransferase